jgi:uncharacterized phage protein (TIGR02216 family)
MAAGFGLLRLSPLAFWSLTPRELDAALGAILGPAAAAAPLSRRELSRLMRRFPDFPSPPREERGGEGGHNQRAMTNA